MRRGSTGRPYHTENCNKDTGCALHPRCLECPEPDCIWDSVNKGAERGREQQRWAAEIAALRAEGKTIPQIAAVLRISVRQVHRRVEVGTARS